MKTTTSNNRPRHSLLSFPRHRLAVALHCALLGLSAPALAQTTAPAAASDNVLGEIKVQGARAGETATGPVIGYQAGRSAVGTKTDTPLNEVAQAISVVTADQIQDTGARSLQDALGYTAGVSAEQGSYGALSTESFMIRGFEVQPFSGGILRDGMKYQPNVYNGAQETYGLERVEVLKGASSLLYGTGAPGGVINTVSKRPSADMLKELSVTVGSDQRRQVAGDYGGALDDAGVWTYRLTGLARQGDSVRLRRQRPHLRRAGADVAAVGGHLADPAVELPAQQGHRQRQPADRRLAAAQPERPPAGRALPGRAGLQLFRQHAKDHRLRLHPRLQRQPDAEPGHALLPLGPRL